MMLCHNFRHHLDRAFVIKALARADIEFIHNGIQLLLTVARKIRAFGKILAKQTVDIFVTTTLPGTMRIAEIDGHPVF